MSKRFCFRLDNSFCDNSLEFQLLNAKEGKVEPVEAVVVDQEEEEE